jgi:hypothetical protein
MAELQAAASSERVRGGGFLGGEGSGLGVAVKGGGTFGEG